MTITVTEYIDRAGGQAFPRPDAVGMSLRDWFAGQALAGLLSNPNWAPVENGTAEARYAGAAYLQADAMLAERAKP